MFWWLICDYGGDFDDFGIWWWFDYMVVLYDNFMLWGINLVIDVIMVHDLFMVDGLCDDFYMELACIMIYNNLGVILLNLYLRLCLLLGGDSIVISTRTTWVTNLLLLLFSFKFSFWWWRGRKMHVFKFVNLAKL